MEKNRKQLFLGNIYGKLIKWGLQEVSGGMWLQKPILATTRGGAFCFSGKTRPWNFGTCFGDFEFKIDEHPDYLLYFSPGPKI